MKTGTNQEYLKKTYIYRTGKLLFWLEMIENRRLLILLDAMKNKL